MSVRRAQQEIDSREFAEWLAFMELEPFGPARDDLRAGTLAALIANVNRDPHRHGPFEPADFFAELKVDEATPGLPDDASLEAKLMAWATRTNAALSTKGG